jgi:Protein kinase domain
MSWPLSQDYNEAIQSPASNFTDADLKRGEAVANALGIPMPYSGNFADVYQVRCPDGSRWAVKCFTREAPGLRERYQEISTWLRRAKLPFTVDFSYLEQGIRVGGKWHPILKMQWVEGLTLNQFVSQYIDKPAMLEALLQLWARMGKYLRDAEVGHCDLQHGNVLLVPGSTPGALALKLIDYDGMWVPALAWKKSGEVGHPSYQHPQRLREGTYSLEVDRFPLLVVAAALRCLRVGGRRLWDRYDNGDNLLFKEADFSSPHQSPLFAELLTLNDPEARSVAAQLMAAAQKRLDQTPLLEEVFPEKSVGHADQPAPHTVPISGGVAQESPQVASRAVTAPSGPPAGPIPRWLPDVVRAERAGSPLIPGPLRRASRMDGKTGNVPVGAWVVGAVVLVFLLASAAGAFYLLKGNNLTKQGMEPSVAQNRPSEIDSHETVKQNPDIVQKDTETSKEGPLDPRPNKEVVNSIGMKLVVIPAGKFIMGSPPGPAHIEVVNPQQLASCCEQKTLVLEWARCHNPLKSNNF